MARRPHDGFSRLGGLGQITLLASILSACASDPLLVGGAPVAEGYVLDGPELLRPTAERRDRAPATVGDLVQVFVEIPAGTLDKWQVRDDGAIAWEREAGRPRVVDYLGYPGNYGFVPSTMLGSGGDGDPLDALVLGPPLARGSLVRARPIALLRLIDAGERDDKVLAVPLEGPLSAIHSLEALERERPGVTDIVATWFSHYDDDPLQSLGWEGAAAAREAIEEARRDGAVDPSP